MGLPYLRTPLSRPLNKRTSHPKPSTFKTQALNNQALQPQTLKLSSPDSPTASTATSPHPWELESKLTLNPYPSNLTRLRTLIGLYANTVDEYRAAVPRGVFERALTEAPRGASVASGSGAADRCSGRVGEVKTKTMDPAKYASDRHTKEHLEYVVGVVRRKAVLEEVLGARGDWERFGGLMGRAVSEYTFIE